MPSFDVRVEGDTAMRFMSLLKVDRSTETGVLADEKLLTDLGKYSQLVKAPRTVVARPFREPTNPVCSFWLGEALPPFPRR